MENHNFISCHYCGKEKGDSEYHKKKKKDKDSQYHTCSLCKSAVYCGEECFSADWVLHQLDCNVYDVGSLVETVFVPYFYEDRIFNENPSEIQQLPVNSPIFQAHQMRYVNPNRTVYTRVEEPLLIQGEAISLEDKRQFMGAGGNPKDLDLDGEEYSIEVTSDGSSLGKVTGTIPDDMIFKSNKNNPAARQLAGGGIKGFFGAGFRRRMMRESNSVVFWPAPAAVREQNMFIPVVGGKLEVVLRVGEAEIRVSGVYRLGTAEETSRLKGQAQRLFQRQLRTKFSKSGLGKATRVGLADVKVIRGRDLQGNQVAIAVLMSRGSNRAEIIDIEFMTVQSTIKSGGISSNIKDNVEEGWVKQKIECNPMDIDHVNGLCQSLEQHVADHKELLETLKRGNTDPHCPVIQECEDDLNNLQRDFAIIRKHKDKLEAGEIEKLPMEVASAFNRAFEDLYSSTIIDKSVKFYNSKVARSGGTTWVLDTANRKVKAIKAERTSRDKLKTKHSEAKGLTKAKIWAQMKISSAKISRMRKDIKNLEKAIVKRLRQGDISSEGRQQLTEAQSVIQSAQI